ncbi:ABC-F family ATP-binding cassette domain-containing protein [Rhodopseudomonas sp. NSM]|uniref:ABC-F family ATP-binding cassette domain-containing protein n=1 Tax=Rhodopseudomonas sp. NSM TaxID=3457630 RepID=UPI004036B14F
MSAPIVLSKLTLATPGGRPLLTDLDLSFAVERTGLIGRNGVGKSSLLSMIAGERSPLSGTISATGRIAMLRQAVQVRPDETIADLFDARAGLALVRKAERGEADPGELDKVDWTIEPRLAAALARFGLGADAETSLAALSGGQATRARLAALVFSEPDFLLLDEPTNNLDRDGRRAVIDLLAGWRGGAIVVSHDRELLETVDTVVELTSLGATRYGGNWSRYVERKAIELSAAARDLTDAERRLAEIGRKAQAAVERQARRDGAGKRKRAKGDMPRILAGARKDRSEDSGGEHARAASRQRVDALHVADRARQRVEILQPMSLALAPTGLAEGKTVLALDQISIGYEPGRPILRDLSLSIVGPERVAIVGRNASGKTTLLRLLNGDLRPWHGTVDVTAHRAMFDQQVSLLDPVGSILANYQRINPDTDANDCRAALARFMFRGDAALQAVGQLSGGQLLRAGLACILGGRRPPALLILDEPTNHLDLDSIRALEAGLIAYDGALVVVSHDEAFLDAIGVSRKIDLTAEKMPS